MRLTALIVDDEAPARKRLRDLIAAEPDIDLVGECEDGPSAVDAILALEPDILFLDVQMPEMDGFEVLDAVGVGVVPSVVFVTAYDEHALAAFEARAIDYLLKPFTRKRFSETLRRVRPGPTRPAAAGRAARRDRLLGARTDRLERIPVRSGQRIRFLTVDSIDWIEGDGNYVRLHAGPAEHRVRGTLKSFAERLSGRGFVRIHQSYVVNLDRVRELQPWSHGEFVVVLANGKKLVSSRTYSGVLKRVLDI
jgi:two-component system LytT family response regulator